MVFIPAPFPARVFYSYKNQARLFSVQLASNTRAGFASAANAQAAVPGGVLRENPTPGKCPEWVRRGEQFT